MRKVESFNPENETSAGIDLLSLLNPAEYFSSPRQVLEAPTLTEQEKRAILANWASDQYAVESVPGLRELPGSHALIALQDILAALKQLDGPEVEIRRSWSLKWPKPLKMQAGGRPKPLSAFLQKNLAQDLERRNPKTKSDVPAPKGPVS
jgi:hypothetical protein